MLIALIIVCAAAALFMHKFFPHVGALRGGLYVSGVVFAALLGLIAVAAP